MVDKTIVRKIKQYLRGLPKAGIHPKSAVLFGSFARGDAHEYSDIDLIVVAPEFDRPFGIHKTKKLWRATLEADIRIEPIPCGERQWETDNASPILEIARREGIAITL
ncbi:MAG TPA: nucleotidyltransferase domain-containing protein [Candidatus Hydrogenedentes bacterium]|nr:nucleotidyltransferase domain-containing protein [Candidatus Hydrogenedentota bacterium]